jgi:D-glycero-D-manno-heptose 1,7-bisphosphate phosphatase
MKNIKCVFLDRDGIINKDTGYIKSYEEIIWKKNIFKTLRYIKLKKIYICIVTNQSGVARGYFKENDLIKIHKKMNAHIKQKINFKIDEIRYCPYLKESKIKKYKKDSMDRKPNPGMILKTIKKQNFNRSECIMFGDRKTDLIAAKKAGIKGFLITNNLYSEVKKYIR